MRVQMILGVILAMLCLGGDLAVAEETAVTITLSNQNDSDTPRFYLPKGSHLLKEYWRSPLLQKRFATAEIFLTAVVEANPSLTRLGFTKMLPGWYNLSAEVSVISAESESLMETREMVADIWDAVASLSGQVRTLVEQTAQHQESIGRQNTTQVDEKTLASLVVAELKSHINTKLNDQASELKDQIVVPWSSPILYVLFSLILLFGLVSFVSWFSTMEKNRELHDQLAAANQKVEEYKPYVEKLEKLEESHVVVWGGEKVEVYQYIEGSDRNKVWKITDSGKTVQPVHVDKVLLPTKKLQVVPA